MTFADSSDSVNLHVLSCSDTVISNKYINTMISILPLLWLSVGVRDSEGAADAAGLPDSPIHTPLYESAQDQSAQLPPPMSIGETGERGGPSASARRITQIDEIRTINQLQGVAGIAFVAANPEHFHECPRFVGISKDIPADTEGHHGVDGKAEHISPRTVWQVISCDERGQSVAAQTTGAGGKTYCKLRNLAPESRCFGGGFLDFIPNINPKGKRPEGQHPEVLPVITTMSAEDQGIFSVDLHLEKDSTGRKWIFYHRFFNEQYKKYLATCNGRVTDIPSNYFSGLSFPLIPIIGDGVETYFGHLAASCRGIQPECVTSDYWTENRALKKREQRALRKGMDPHRVERRKSVKPGISQWELEMPGSPSLYGQRISMDPPESSEERNRSRGSISPLQCAKLSAINDGLRKQEAQMEKLESPRGYVPHVIFVLEKQFTFVWEHVIFVL